MSKTKAYISSSDESGSSDEQVKRVEPVVTDVSKEANKSTKRLSTDDIEPPSKKSKTAVKKKKVDTPPPKSSGAGVKVGDEVRFELGKMKFATVSEFRGRKMVNIREFYMNGEGELRPGKKGIALMPDQWEKLKNNMDEIDEVLDNL